MSDANDAVDLLVSDNKTTGKQQDDECLFGSIIEHLPEHLHHCNILKETNLPPLPSLTLVKLVEPHTKSLITQVFVSVNDTGAKERATPGARQINRAG